MTPSKGGTQDQDLREILDRENLELEKGTNKGIKSLPQEEFDRVQQLFLRRYQTKATGFKRNYDSQDNKGVKQMESISGYSTKNPGKKRGRRRQNDLLSECGKLLINSGKMKDLTSYSFTNTSL